ncbi:SDR family NAD(P)-dependent oxidoreductase [Ruania alba]|uniref:NAD(P)-dependent dehydrogenase, short-chain alcohol dehydrogenase family n=1 Tax=Ruania alba TaxID=648782 RepID=A0A1H5GUL6_9MICO|nr:SDR family oxidoreductase [Ruania alba]SEE19409.1 NAD(P)-dependent dehydrogenase, short-chain alcohol dehydrogenase family [Ruania alba]
MRFSNKVAVVTGGGAGIGRQTVNILAAEGASVVVADLDGRLAEEASQEAVRLGAPDAASIQLDIASEEANIALAELCASRFGGVDVLVNNAAARVWGPVTEATVDSWRWITEVNLIGVGLTCKHIIPLMAGRAGSVVSVSSANGITGRAGMAQYDATKAGVLALTRSMACDHADAGVRVNAILPGPTLTDFHKNRAAEAGKEIDLAVMTPHEGGPGIQRRQGRPEEIGHAIAFLASDHASYITGACLAVDGGLTALSGRLG